MRPERVVPDSIVTGFGGGGGGGGAAATVGAGVVTAGVLGAELDIEEVVEPELCDSFRATRCARALGLRAGSSGVCAVSGAGCSIGAGAAAAVVAPTCRLLT